MHTQNLLFFLFFCFAGPLQANTSPATTPFKANECAYPAPTNFQVAQTGTTWAKFTWNAPPTPRPHIIRVFRSSDHVQVGITIASAGSNEATVIGLPEATAMYAKATAVCPNGEEGPEAIVLIPVIILDLIVKGFVDAPIPSNCSIQSAPNSCPFQHIGTTFNLYRHQNPSNSCKFRVQFTNGRYQIIPQPGCTDYSFFCNYTSGLANPSCLNTPSIIVKDAFSSTTIAIISVSNSGGSGTSAIDCSFLNKLYWIQRLAPDGLVGKGEDETERSATIDYPTLSQPSANPNPFSAALDVMLPQPIMASGKLQLFNLSGQLIVSQTLSAGQGQHTLPTESILPGFYFLRVDADGTVYSLKVIKSE